MALAQRGDAPNRSKLKSHLDAHRQSSSSGQITCFVTQPDNVVLHVDVDGKAKGQEVLNKICTLLGIQDEADYFGLQYALSKGDLIWLNMRNRLSKQIPGSPPFKLFFKVKYFVPPYNLVLEETKHQFYLNAVQQLKLGLWDAETSLELQSRLIALMTYVQFGGFNSATTPCKYACFWSDRRAEIPHEVISMAATFHRQLTGMSVRAAQYELLRTTHEEVPAFGVYFYQILDMFGRRLLMGVGPEFVALCQTDFSFIERFPYCRLKTVTISGRVVTLNLLEDDASVKMRNYELSSKRSADCLYRSITELHCFFRCDNIRDDVLNRTNPSINFATIFDHNNTREYTFDVRYTSREVHDRARRNLYHAANEASGSFGNAMTTAATTVVGSAESGGSAGVTSPLSIGSMHQFEDSTHVTASSPTSLNPITSHTSHSDSMASMEEEVQEMLQRWRREEVKCRVCMDRPVKCVFVPCGHLSCEECGLRLTHCHICRKAIELRQRCYFPWDEDQKFPSLSSHPPCSASSSAVTAAAAVVDRAVAKSHRTVAFNIHENAESDVEGGAGSSSDEEEEGTESGEVMQPGAFDFFHRHRRQSERDRQSSSTSSALSAPLERVSP
ncbi:E3 ubiquitin protein ligase MYLIP [Echinococcus multilocularis]|uniref:E3 ubiquitin protein ligase MYLIP n=1 Tax=Echinococcus multilocularis TaxID=6211 RepID=A0A068XZ12_ECHMU|nr:E3 ubiquitin protein ligase MYLIP [Echinococcus multilocularis]